MRKIFSFILSLLLAASLAVTASAAEGFIYCEAMDLITEQLDMPQHQAMSVITKLTIKGVVKNHPGRLISLN